MVTTEREIEADETASLVRRFSLEEFAAVADASPDDRIELINGEIITVPPPDKIHIEKTNQMIELFAHHMREVTALGCQISGSNAYFEVPVELRQQWVEAGVRGPSNACPDASICYRDYLRTDRRPPALLVVEVISIARREHIDRDLVVKPDIYASLVIPAYWVIDHRDDTVWAHTEPLTGKYAARERYRGDSVLPAPGLEFLQLTPAHIFG